MQAKSRVFRPSQVKVEVKAEGAKGERLEGRNFSARGDSIIKRDLETVAEAMRPGQWSLCLWRNRCVKKAFQHSDHYSIQI